MGTAAMPVETRCPVQEGDLGQDDRSLGMPQVQHEEGKFDFDKPQCS